MLSSDMGVFLDFTVDNSTCRILGYGVGGSVGCRLFTNLACSGKVFGAILTRGGVYKEK